MKHEPRRGGAVVELVARDRRAGVRELDPRLVGAPRLETEPQIAASVAASAGLHVGDGRLALRRADDLHETVFDLVERVAKHLRGDSALDQRDVSLLYLALLERLRDRRVRLATTREEQEAARVLVEALVHTEVRIFPLRGKIAPEPGHDVLRLLGARRLGRHPRRFVHDDQVGRCMHNPRIVDVAENKGVRHGAEPAPPATEHQALAADLGAVTPAARSKPARRSRARPGRGRACGRRAPSLRPPWWFRT